MGLGCPLPLQSPLVLLLSPHSGLLAVPEMQHASCGRWAFAREGVSACISLLLRGLGNFVFSTESESHFFRKAFS